MSAAEHDPDPASDALGVFLDFREADMLLWRRAGAALGISTMAALGLARILRANERQAPLRQVDLSESLGLSAAGTSAIVTALVERGFVHREPSLLDGRAVHLTAGEHVGPVLDELLAADAKFLRLAGEVSAEGLRGFMHIMAGMGALSGQKYAQG